jgi:hypothetical protein
MATGVPFKGKTTRPSSVSTREFDDHVQLMVVQIRKRHAEDSVT